MDQLPRHLGFSSHAECQSLIRGRYLKPKLTVTGLVAAEGDGTLPLAPTGVQPHVPVSCGVEVRGQAGEGAARLQGVGAMRAGKARVCAGLKIKQILLRIRHS